MCLSEIIEFPQPKFCPKHAHATLARMLFLYTLYIKTVYKICHKYSIWLVTQKDTNICTYSLSNLCPHFQTLPLLCVCVKSLQFCPALHSSKDCSLPGSSVHGILQARILEWAAISFSRGSSQPRYGTHLLHWQADSLPLTHLGSN